MHANVVVIEGIIGAGKSSLAKTLGEALGIKVMSEPVEENPYLEFFYQDPKRYAFEMQMHMLMRRHAQQQEASWRCLNGSKGVVLDRSLPGDRVFCRLQRDLGNIGELGCLDVNLNAPPKGALRPNLVRAVQEALDG